MAPKKVTIVEKPKRKIIMTTVELKKKNFSLCGKRVHVYRTWPFNAVWLVDNIDRTEEQGSHQSS